MLILLFADHVVSFFDLMLLSPKPLDSNCGAETQIFDSHHVVIFKCYEPPRPPNIFMKSLKETGSGDQKKK